MLKKLFLLILITVTLAFSIQAQDTKTLTLPKPTPTPQTPPPGNIQLLYGYTHTKMRGFDTSVGEISKPDGMKISYDIGIMAGRYVMKCGRRDLCHWYKAQKIGDREVWLGLTKEGQILAFFPKEHANFYAQTKSQEDIADFLIMILTYKVNEPTSQDKSLTSKPN